MMSALPVGTWRPQGSSRGKRGSPSPPAGVQPGRAASLGVRFPLSASLLLQIRDKPALALGSHSRKPVWRGGPRPCFYTPAPLLILLGMLAPLTF